MEIEEAGRRCRSVVERIQSLPLSKVMESCKGTLLRLANSELNYLSRLSLSASSVSCNVGYIEAIVHILQQPYITGVSRVCKPIPLSSATNSREKIDTQCEAVHVDIICSFHKNPAWFMVSNRNPKYICWDSSGKNKGLKVRVQQIVHAAQSSQVLKPASIILFFANGLEIVIIEKLKNDFGFRDFKLDFSYFDVAFADALEGEWINVLAESYRGACTLIIDIYQYPKVCRSIDYVMELNSSCIDKDFTKKYNELSLNFSFGSVIMEMREWPLDTKDLQCGRKEDLLGDEELLNFDTTALIAIISGISNGGAEKILAVPENELRHRFKNNTEFVISQALSEIRSPIHAEVNSILSEKKGIACETVHSEFMELVAMCGGPNEKIRADQLVKRIKIVPDTPSQRMKGLPTTRKLALKNKVTFGTGDYWRAPTLTANMGFVRAVSQTGMSLLTVEHRPRALIGD